ncbi:hypothetical protein PC112_g22092 [Phytophthora cactorum]|nr:hypothetical protein PC112_g22092 [Phytophthora cactorum]KAG3053801.1 hypothetical protein PC122_g22227 [Phytophthora cactorum]
MRTAFSFEDNKQLVQIAQTSTSADAHEGNDISLPKHLLHATSQAPWPAASSNTAVPTAAIGLLPFLRHPQTVLQLRRHHQDLWLPLRRRPQDVLLIRCHHQENSRRRRA